MSHKLRKIVFPIISFMALVALACTCGGGTGGLTGTDTPAPIPTKSSPPTKPPVEVPTQSTVPTKPPIGGGDSTPVDDATPVDNTTGGSVDVSSDEYTHTSGAFSTLYPVGWEKKERDDGVYFSDPTGVGAVDISFTNVGTTLSEDALNAYINNLENNWFGSFSDYSAQKPEKQSDNSILVSKTLTDSNGKANTVVSFYWQLGTVVYEQDFWALSDSFQSYADGYNKIAASIKTNDTAGATSNLYLFQYTFTCPNKLCEFSAPYGWAYGHDDTTYNFTTNDKFTSPDGLSYIDNTVYDDGTAISKSVAGKFALSLLQQFYAKDVSITDDKVQNDGSERLDWVSKSGNFEGETFFETRGTTFLMWTWVVNSDSYDIYNPLWGDIVGSYTIPQ